jgi:biopolymer transport protein ExbD
MAINVGAARDGEPVAEINTTPLIDVMLVLLVMLIITLPQQKHAVKLDTPIPCDPCEQPPPRPEAIRVTIEGDGLILWNGEAVNRAALRARLAAEAKRSEQAELHIEVSRYAKYGAVAHVMAAAQREGVTRMGIVSVG